MIIRKVRKEDVSQVVELCKAHAHFEESDFEATGKENLLTEHLFESNTGLECLVVELDDEVVGYATFIKQFSTWDAGFYLYLDCLYLKDQLRGKGVGTSLMKEIKDFARSENCEQIQWQTPDFNKKAIGFYTNIGAVSKSKERFFWEVK